MASLLQFLQHMTKTKKLPSLLSLSFAAILSLTACSPANEQVVGGDSSKADQISECTECGDELISCLSGARLILGDPENAERLVAAEVGCQERFDNCAAPVAACEAPPLDTTCTDCFDGMVECLTTARDGELEGDALVGAESGCQMDFNDCEAIVINEFCVAPEPTSCTECYDSMVECVGTARGHFEEPELVNEEAGCQMSFNDCEATVIGDSCIAPVFTTCTECFDDMVECVGDARADFEGDELTTAESGCQMAHNECAWTAVNEECVAPSLDLTCLDCGTGFAGCIAEARGAGLDADELAVDESGCQMSFNDCSATLLSDDVCVQPSV